MAGIYLHIPFCKQACHYCDFHFTTSLKYKDDLIAAMHKELELQKNYLQHETVETIYFGGGTPSLIGTTEIQKLIDHIAALSTITSDAEITLEANPDDLEQDAVSSLRQSSINRFSIGIQSFFEEDLKWMNRAHNSIEAANALKRVQDAGFSNITVDLIYGYPLLSNTKWEDNIAKVIESGVPHVSAYSMTVEDKTALAHFIKKGVQPKMNESQSADQFLILTKTLENAGFEHYEISNFAQPGRYSKHNSNYWKGIKYIGIGPSAHSFNGASRHWNVSNNSKYIKALQNDIVPAEYEELSIADKFNEYIMTSLRTMWGIDLNKVDQEFGNEHHAGLLKGMAHFLEKGWLINDGNRVILSKEGKLFADNIAAELFIE